MKKPAREALDAYYREAGTWASDRLGHLEKSRRVAWWVAIGAALVAVLEAAALLILMPLKTVEPYTLLVDRQTGFVQALGPLNPEAISPDRALTQSMLVQYVIARESFDAVSLRSNYRKVGLWSADQARADYLDLMRPNNPQGPLAVYPRTSSVVVQVKSVSTLDPQTAMVRFETVRMDAGGARQVPEPWVAVVQFRYSGEPMSADDRYLNPLGFQVVSYRRNAESLAFEPAEQPASDALTDVPIDAEPVP